MKNTLKGYVIGVLTTIMLIGCVTYAASNTKTIEALYNNIKIYVDGVKIDPKDANGNAVEPFIYNGTTYLPVRAVSEAIGKTVTWDGSTQSVYLGIVPGKTQNWMNVCKPYEYDHGKEYSANDNKHFVMSGNKYTNGFTLDACIYDLKSFALFNLNGKYSSLSFNVGHIDGTSKLNGDLNIYLDGNLVKSVPLTHDSGVKNVNIPLNGALHMKIEIVPESAWYKSGTYGFADGVFK